MPSRMRGRSGSRSGSSVRRTSTREWIGSVLDIGGGVPVHPAGPSTTHTNWIPNLTLEALSSEPTLLRTRFHFHYAGFGSQNVNGVYGLIHVKGGTSTTVSGATTARPIADSDADWIFWQPFSGISGLAGVQANGNQGSGTFEVDVRSMRKTDSSSQIVGVIETTAGSSGFFWTASLRCLFLCP
jgi:hypothetical protein